MRTPILQLLLLFFSNGVLAQGSRQFMSGRSPSWMNRRQMDIPNMFRFATWADELCSHVRKQKKLLTREQKERCRRLGDLVQKLQIQELHQRSNGRAPQFGGFSGRNMEVPKYPAPMYRTQRRMSYGGYNRPGGHPYQIRGMLHPQFHDYASFLLDDMEVDLAKARNLFQQEPWNHISNQGSPSDMQQQAFQFEPIQESDKELAEMFAAQNSAVKQRRKREVGLKEGEGKMGTDDVLLNITTTTSATSTADDNDTKQQQRDDREKTKGAVTSSSSAAASVAIVITLMAITLTIVVGTYVHFRKEREGQINRRRRAEEQGFLQ